MKTLTKEQTDKIFNTITSNGCREMEEDRFHQAVNEALQIASNDDEMLKVLKNVDKLLGVYARTTEESLYGKGVDAEIWAQVKIAIDKAETK